MRAIAAILVSTAVLASGVPARGASLKALQGAWAAEGTECSSSFTSKGGKVRFKNREGSLNNGLIVSGDRVEGPNATCTAHRVKEEKGHFTALMTCSTAVVFGDISPSFRIVDENTFEHFPNAFPESADRYHRCGF